MKSNNQRINVLYVIWSLGLGGAERVVINLAKGLDKAKFNPIVCCLNDKGIFSQELEQEGIKVIALNKKKKIEISLIRKLMQVMIDNNIQIVHTHLWGANFWGRIAARKTKVKVIIATEHNEDTWKPGFYFILDRWLSRSTDRLIAVSNRVKEFYAAKGIPAEKIEVIYNGVEMSGRPVAQSPSRPVKEEFGIKEDETVLAIIGRLVPQKGHRYLFEAVNSLNGQYKVKLLVVGDGPSIQSLRSQVLSLKLEDKVIFTGLRKDVPDIFSAVDILVMPSLREGLPIIALEAMAYGVPIIATKVGGITEIITDGQNGLLVKPENQEEIKQAIIRLINDKGLSQYLANNARNKLKDNFTSGIMIRKTQSLYEELYRIKINKNE